MATLTQSVQASCISQYLTSNLYNADDVINTGTLSGFNVLTFDNIGSGGNQVTSIQANCFLPIMYDTKYSCNKGYVYYDTKFYMAIGSTPADTYTLVACDNTKATWASTSGTCCFYTCNVPTGTTTTNIYSDSDKCTCVDTLSATDITINTVSACYECNLKINEANIPYISAELITHGELPTTVVPKTDANLSEQVGSDVPLTKGAVLETIQGVARAAYYNNGILSLWGYGTDGNMYITDAISLGASTDISAVTADFFDDPYPLAT